MKKFDIKSYSKNTLVFLTVIGFLIIVLSLTISYAYYDDYILNRDSETLKVTIGKYKKFSFTEGSSNYNEFSEDMFESNDISIRDEITSEVSLVGGTSEPNVTEIYNVYLDIPLNSYEYTTESKTPEIILTITDHHNNIITDIDGLDFVTKELNFDDGHGSYTEEIRGFDITEVEELIKIQENVEITSNSTDTLTIQNWNFQVIFVNLSTNQISTKEKQLKYAFLLSPDIISYESSLYDTIITNNGGVDEIKKEIVDFDKTPVLDNTITSDLYSNQNGLYFMEDDYGDSYYFRGSVENNWVSFGGFYWRIIRLNGDGSIRLLYSDSILNDLTEDHKYVNIQNTNIGRGEYDYNYSDYDLGYMYDQNMDRGYTYSSDIKNDIDDWYSKNLINYENYISDTLFCNDKTIYLSDGSFGSAFDENFTYASYNRIIANEPSFKCINKEDAYTVNDEVYGNGHLTYPIALITADELIAAGVTNNYSSIRTHYYNANNNFSTMTPYIKNKITTYSYDHLGNSNPYDYIGIRPVINIKGDSNIKFIGNGTYYYPYELLNY